MGKRHKPEEIVAKLRQVDVLTSQGATVADASAYQGVEVDATGNDESYNVHLRTAGLQNPWQSYRQCFVSRSGWQTHRLPFAAFVGHRTELPLDLRRLRRIGLVAIGREFTADIAISGIRFYR